MSSAHRVRYALLPACWLIQLPIQCQRVIFTGVIFGLVDPFHTDGPNLLGNGHSICVLDWNRVLADRIFLFLNT